MATLFETDRLLVRHWEPETDVQDAFEMYANPEVMRFLGRTPQVVEDTTDMSNRLQRIVSAYSGGMGSWAILDKERSALVGAVLVKVLPDADGNPTGDVEVGWHLKQSEWGKGYATEAARAAIRYAFEELGLGVIYSVVYKENTRSIAVTERLGMSPKGPTDKYYGVTVELFELRKP